MIIGLVDALYVTLRHVSERVDESSCDHPNCSLFLLFVDAFGIESFQLFTVVEHWGRYSGATPTRDQALIF